MIVRHNFYNLQVKLSRNMKVLKNKYGSYNQVKDPIIAHDYLFLNEKQRSRRYLRLSGMIAVKPTVDLLGKRGRKGPKKTLKRLSIAVRKLI